MQKKLRLKQVFTPGGLPSVTYVSRDELGLEAQISDALERGYAFVVVTGPTKSGKSVLCRRVLASRRHVLVEGGHVRSEGDFWAQIAYQLNIAASASKTHTEASSTTVTGGGGVSILGIGNASGSSAVTGGSNDAVTASYNNVPILACLNKLQKEDVVLIVDDFHFIQGDVQKSMIRALKGPVFEGLGVILLAVPHRALDPLGAELEIDGRTKHITIPSWALDDLIKITEAGFSALNVSLKRALRTKICEDSYGSPLIVQEICSELCLRAGIKERRSHSVTLDAKLLGPTYVAMAAAKASPLLDKLRRGPEGRRERRKLGLRGGGSCILFEGLTIALARLGPQQITSYSDIRWSLQGVLGENVKFPHKAEIVSALRSMCVAALEGWSGEPPLEWIDDADELVITDPFILFYMRLSLRDQGTQADIELPDEPDVIEGAAFEEEV